MEEKSPRRQNIMSKTLYILCEGQTEEAFIKTVLYDYFANLNIYVIPIICSTKRIQSRQHKGGVTSYSTIKTELYKLSQSHKNEFITTMFDYYAMPDDTPYIDCVEPDIYKRINIIENAINQDIGQNNCKFNFMLHEFEAILFSNPNAFSILTNIDTNTIIQSIQTIKGQFDTPEHINNFKETAPSKRILKLIPSYAKVKDGVRISSTIGIDTIMQECLHFKKWIDFIKNWLS